jgi:hypothetical protein
VCVVGDFGVLRAQALVSEADLDDIRVGEPVRSRLRAQPGLLLRGEIEAIESLPVDAGVAHAYRVWMALQPPRPEDARGLRAGLTGTAHLVTPARSAAAHAARWVARFLRVDLWV